MEILRSAVKLLLITLLIVIGSKVLYKDNFAILTGSVILKESPMPGEKFAQTKWEIDYPTGYNKDNCIVIAFGGRLDSRPIDYGYSYGYNENANTSVSMMSGSMSRNISLNSSQISVEAWNISNAPKTFQYKIVLMKI